MEFKARHNLGYAEFLAGDLPLALTRWPGPTPSTSTSRAACGCSTGPGCSWRRACSDEAEEALAEAAAPAADERANQDRAETQLERAQVALLQGDWGAAKAHSRRARRDFRRRQSIGWLARADVTRWQAVPRHQGRRHGWPARSGRRPTGDPGRSPATTTGRPRGLLLAAEAHLGLGHVDEATDLLHGVGAPDRARTR